MEHINKNYKNTSLNVPLRVHIAVNHIIPVIINTNTDNRLGIYSEQAGECIS